MKINVMDGSFVYKVLTGIAAVFFFLFMLVVIVGIIVIFPLAVILATRDNETIKKTNDTLLKDFFNI